MTEKTTVVNVYARQRCDVKILRGTYKAPTKWGNPHRLAKPRTPEGEARCLLAHALHLRDTGLVDDVGELRGKVLGCCCAPARCHGDTLARLADAEDARAELELVIEELSAEVERYDRAARAQGMLFGGGQ